MFKISFETFEKDIDGFFEQFLSFNLISKMYHNDKELYIITKATLMKIKELLYDYVVKKYSDSNILKTCNLLQEINDLVEGKEDDFLELIYKTDEEIEQSKTEECLKLICVSDKEVEKTNKGVKEDIND